MFRRLSLLIVTGAIILVASIFGCSGTGSPVAPVTTDANIVQSAASGHFLWGVYNISIDPATLEAEIVPLRGPAFTANVTQFMQPPSSPIHMISLKIDSSSDAASGYFVVDVTLRHPFPGINTYNGFDVRGILLSNASMNLGFDSTAEFAGLGDTMLLNADGYARWWNWQEFKPFNTIFGATYGKLAPPNQPTATVNGYKYFADELDLESPVTDLNPEMRGFFASVPGNNQRRYEIQFKMNGPSVVFDFNYAVDASWAEPDAAFAPEFPPAAFPPDANCAEPYLVTVTDNNSTAWYVDDTNTGGSLILDIEVFDWQAVNNPLGVPGEIAGLWLEGEPVAAPIDLLPLAKIIDGGPTSSVFQVEISDLALTHSGQNEIWIIAENSDPSTYEPNLENFDTSHWTWPESALAAYLRTSIDISSVQTQTAPEVNSIDPDSGNQGSEIPATVYGTYFANGCQVELRESGGSFVIEAGGETWIDETEVNCSLDLSGAPLGLYDVVVINPDFLDGSLDEGFEVLEANIIYVDDSNTSGIEDGTMSNPYNTIQEGLTAASSGWDVWIDDSDASYAGPVTLKSGVDLVSMNWDNTDGDEEATIEFLSASAAVVNGTDNASIDGFAILGQYCGIDCNGTSPEILNCRVADLLANSPRGIWLRNGSHAHLDGVEVDDVSNSYYYGYDTFYGILIENCDASGGDGVVIEHMRVHNVYSQGLNGGGYCYPHGIFINNSDGVIIRNSTVHAVTGGNYHYVYGVRVEASADVELVNDVIYDIDKTYYYGTSYGLLITNCTNLDARNLIISHVHKGEDGTGGYFQTAYGVSQSGSTYSFVYSDVYDCQTANYENLTPGTGCISANPLYVNAGTDFHLGSGSPCINTGDPGIDDTDGSQSDMGAYGGPGGSW